MKLFKNLFLFFEMIKPNIVDKLKVFESKISGKFSPLSKGQSKGKRKYLYLGGNGLSSENEASKKKANPDY